MFKSSHIALTILSLGIIISLTLHKSQLADEIKGMHSWRQAQTMWNIRNFERHDANIMNPRGSHFNTGKGNIVRYEFPIMQWSIAMVQKVFGEHIMVVRICMFMIGLLAVLGFYRLLLLLEIGYWLAALGAVLFLFSPILHAYIFSPLPDILALAAGVWYLYATLKYQRNPDWGWLLLSGLALSLSTSAKLPFLMFSVVSIYFFFQSIFQTKRLSKDNLRFALVQLALVLPALAWYAWVMPTWPENPVLKGIFADNTAWDNVREILLFYLNTTLPSAVLNYVLVAPFILGLFYGRFSGRKQGWIFPLAAITILYAILQCTALSTFHDYYFLPFLPWMYIMVVLGIHLIWLRFPKYTLWIASLISCYSVILSHSLATPRWSLEVSGYNPALYTHQAELKAVVPDGSLCIMLNDASYYLFSHLLDKMGYIFQDNYLPASWIQEMIDNKNVTYMYSDSRIVDEHPDVQPLLDTMLMEAGTIRVFKLIDKKE